MQSRTPLTDLAALMDTMHRIPIIVPRNVTIESKEFFTCDFDNPPQPK